MIFTEPILESPPVRNARWFSLGASVLAIAVAVLVLAGWFLRVRILTSIFPGLATMKPNTALCFLLAGGALLLLGLRCSESRSQRARQVRTAQILAGIVATVGLFTLGEYLLGWNLGIDALFFQRTLLATGETYPGRMSLAAAAGFVFLGIGLLFLEAKERFRYLQQSLGLLVTLNGLVACVGYIYGARGLYGVSAYSSIALPTAILFLLLGLGSLAARPQAGLMAIITSEWLGGLIARRILIWAIVVPLSIGWLRWQGELAGFYDTSFGLTIFALSNVVMFTSLVMLGAATVNRADEERRRVEDADMRLVAMVESSSEAIVGKNLEGIITSWNNGAQQLFGYSAAEIVGRPIAALIPPEREHEEQEILGRIRRGERVESFETTRVCKDGRQIEIAATISPVKNAEGRVIGASKIARDITDRKRADAALQQSLATSERALKELADQKFALDQHAIVAFTDVQGTITYVNEKFCSISQYSRDELIGQNHRILNSGHHAKEFFQRMYGTIANGEVWHGEIKNRAKDGSFYWVDTTIVPTLGPEGKPQQYVAIRADISERKRVEANLEKSLATAEEALKELADQKFALDQHAIVAFTDVQGTITYVNEKFCSISQYSRDELIGQNHRILNSGLHPKEFFQLMYQTIAQGKVWHGEIKNRAKDGSFYWVDTTIVPTLSAAGKPRRYVAIRADITERKLAEAALQKQQQELARSNGDLEQFAYAASHDLQEPLRAVAGCVQLLKARYEGKIDARADEFITHAVDGAARMQQLIDDLLAFSRVGTRGAEHQAASCEQALENALKNLSVAIETSQAHIEHDPLPTVFGDLSQLALLFQNLIGNALKFCGSEAPRIHIAAERQNSGWVFSVRDNGIGIDPQYFERIFVIFQRLHTRKEYPGTGMGLALCKKIVERHGGAIWVDSEAGMGTTFRFTLTGSIPDANRNP